MTEKKITARFGTVYYWVSHHAEEDAKCVVFLHGLTADHTLFDKQMERFAKKYTVIVWDAPAHGMSRPYAHFSYDHMADVVRAILHAEHQEHCIIVGQSMGGFIGQVFAKKYPQLLHGFVGIDTCPFGVRYYSHSDLWWLKQVEAMCRAFPEGALKESLARSCTRTPYACQNMRAALAWYGKDELCRLLGMGYTAFVEELENIHISCPVILLVGQFDMTGKVQTYNRMWHKAEGYPLYRIPNAAHNANADNSEWCNAILEKFIREL